MYVVRENLIKLFQHSIKHAEVKIANFPLITLNYLILISSTYHLRNAGKVE